jgi:O-antigen/teichoic acid export membrane protein
MKLFEANTMLPQSYVRATFPRFSKLYHSGYEHFQPVAKRVFLHVTTYAVISACLMVTAGPLALRILFGEKFAGSFNVLRVLSLGIIPYSFGRVLSSALTAGDQQRFDLIAAVIATTVNLSLNALLIPHFGSTGSAIAFRCSLTVGCGAITVFTTRVLRKEFITSALGWGLGIGIGVICLFWLAMFHEIFALTAFLLVFAAAGSIFLAKHNRWQRIMAGSLSAYRNFMNP